MNIVRYHRGRDAGEDGPALVHIALSRRNLETLMKMLDTKVGQPTLRRMTEEDVALYVTAEENAEHYHDKRAPKGVGPEDIE